jgi:D12 class N6 adenine-specific DNA methyltransferase
MLQLIQNTLNPPICEWCNTVFEVKLRGSHRRFCSERCKQSAYRVRNGSLKNVTNSNEEVHNNSAKNVTNSKRDPILKYPGAKWKDAAWITQYIPRSVIFLEPYFGSGAIYFNLPWIPKLAVLNDLDSDIVSLFRVIRDHGDELAARIEATPWARKEYEASFTPTNDPIEAARRFLVRCWHVTAGHCDHCGVEVPIRTLSPDELTQARQIVQREAGHLLTEGIQQPPGTA